MSTFGRTKENTNKRNRTLCKHLSHALLLLLYTTSNKLPLHTASVLHLFNYYVLTIPDSVAKCRHLLPANQITFPLKFLCKQQLELSLVLKCGFLNKSFIMNEPLVSCPFPVINFWWVCCCTHPKVTTENGQMTRGAFIINDFLRNPHFSPKPKTSTR